MKKMNFIFFITISILPYTTHSQSYWERFAPQVAQDAASYTSEKASKAFTGTRDYISRWIPQSIKDSVNSWSTKKKVVVASAIIASLAAIYNRKVIIEWIDNLTKHELSPNVKWKLSGMDPAVRFYFEPLKYESMENKAQKMAVELFENYEQNPSVASQYAGELGLKGTFSTFGYKPDDEGKESDIIGRAFALFFERISPDTISRYQPKK